MRGEGVGAVVLDGHARPADRQVGASFGEADPLGGDVGGVGALRRPWLNTGCQHSPAPAAVGHLAGDHPGHVEPSRIGQEQVEVVPFGPGGVGGGGAAGEVQRVQGAVKLGVCRGMPATVGIHIPPGAGDEDRFNPEATGQPRNRAARGNRNETGIALQIEELVVDPGGRGRDPSLEPRSRENLPEQKRRLLYREVHGACSSRLERLRIDAGGQDDEVAASHQLRVPGLLHQGASDRKQDDRDAHAERVSAQQQHAAPRTLPE